MKLRQTPFYDKLLIADSPPPANPFSVDLETVDRIKNHFGIYALAWMVLILRKDLSILNLDICNKWVP